MKLQWTSKALSDLVRLHEFLAHTHPIVAAQVVQSLSKAPEQLLANPRIGEQLFQFSPREVRKIVVNPYEIRYELVEQTIYILRLWHTREDR